MANLPLSKAASYIFGNGKSTLSGSKVMKKFAEACGVRNFRYLTATCLRKHLATSARDRFSLNEGQTSILLAFQGHNTYIHHRHYERNDKNEQLTNILPLLEVLDGNVPLKMLLRKDAKSHECHDWSGAGPLDTA